MNLCRPSLQGERGCKGFLRLSLVMLFCVALSPTSYSQLSTGSVTGIVRDPSSGAVAGAEVVLQNLDTSVIRNTASNSIGNYQFLNVTPGRYSLSTTATGFKSNKTPEITLSVNETLTLDVTLEVGAVSQTVTVSGQVAEIESSTAELGSVVTEKQVVDLPLNGRNFTQLLSLTPGVAPISVGQNSGGFGAPVVSSSEFVFPAINGQSNRSNYFMTDGIFNLAPVVSTYAVPPIIDSIQEFKIVSHSDQAEYGSSTGGIVNVVSKSGTNSLHGTTWEYLRNDAFDARNAFLQSVTPYKQNMFGFSVGGPVWIPKVYDGKNKTFFYGAFQQFLYHSASEAFYRVPTEANYSGDLSNIPTPIYNPFSTRPDPANPGNFLRDPFPNNQIPVSLFNPAFVAFAKATLPAAGPTINGENNAIDTTPYRQNQREYTFRVDENLGSNDSFFFRYSSIDNTTTSSGGRPGIITALDIPDYNLGVNYVHTFSPSLMLQAQYGRVKGEDNSVTTFPGLPSDVLAAMHFSSQMAGTFGGFSVVPGLGVAGYFNGGAYGLTNPNMIHTNQFKGSLSKMVGSHVFKFGGEYESMNFEEDWYQSAVSFAAQQTGNPENSAQPGSALASFFLDVPEGATVDAVHETTRPGGVMAFYFQDSWKATPRLTVNLGLRYDLTLITPYGKENTVGQHGGIETGDMDFNNGTYVLQKLPPACSVRGFAPCIPGDGTLPAHVVVDPRGKIAHNTTTNWGPRLGLAYRLDNNTTLRAMFGIYYDNFSGVEQTAQNLAGAWPDVAEQIANNLNIPTSAQPTPTVRAENPFVGGTGQFPAPTPFTSVEYFYDPNTKNPYSQQWNLGIERQVNTSTTFSMDYVGSGTRRLDIGGYYNVAQTPGPGNPQDRAVFTYIAPTYYDRFIGKAAYNGLQVMLNQRFNRGFSYQVAYTWSKSLDYCNSELYAADSSGSTGCQDPYNVKGSRGPSGFDLTNVLSVNVLYDVPVGKGKAFQTGNKVADYILGNWQVNGIFLARSGLPYQAIVSGDVANTGNTAYERANIVGNPYVSHVTPAQGLNLAAFAIPNLYTFGDEGRNALRTVPYWNLDTSVFRQFPFLETRRFEIRAEAFNVMNTVIYGQPQNDLASPDTFGQILSTANSARILQLGAKVIF